MIKGTLGQLEVEVLFLHSFKHLSGSFLTFFQGFSEYKDIVNVDDEPPFSDHVSEGGIHEGLEGQRGVALPEEHDQGFIEAIGSGKCSLPLISFLDVYVVIPPS